MAIEEINQAVPAVGGAVAGGGAVFLFAQAMLKRLIRQYDEKHKEHDTRIQSQATAYDSKIEKVDSEYAAKVEKLTDKLSTAQGEVAVLKAAIDDLKHLRADVATQTSRLQGELETKFQMLLDEVAELRADVFVAHERIRLVASGDMDLTKISKPERVRRR